MSWYYNRINGNIQEATGAQKWLLDREIQLEKNVPSWISGQPQIWYGPFATKAEAEAYKQANPSVDQKVTKAASGAISDVTTAITGAANTLVRLATRVLEATVGIVLLAIAANAVLKQATGVDVAGTAKTAGKKAAQVAATAAVA